LKERTYLHHRQVKTGDKGGGTAFAHVQQIEFEKLKDEEELLVDSTYKAITGYDCSRRGFAFFPALVAPGLRGAGATAGDLSNPTSPQKAAATGPRNSRGAKQSACSGPAWTIGSRNFNRVRDQDPCKGSNDRVAPISATPKGIR